MKTLVFQFAILALLVPQFGHAEGGLGLPNPSDQEEEKQLELPFPKSNALQAEQAAPIRPLIRQVDEKAPVRPLIRQAEEAGPVRPLIRQVDEKAPIRPLIRESQENNAGARRPVIYREGLEPDPIQIRESAESQGPLPPLLKEVAQPDPIIIREAVESQGPLPPLLNEASSPDPIIIREGAEQGPLPPLFQEALTSERLLKLQSVLNQKNVQVLVATALSAAMIAHLTKILVTRSALRATGALALLPPQYLDQIMASMGQSETYMIPEHAEYNIEDVKAFLLQAQLQENSAVDLSNVDAEFTQYLLDVMTSIEEQVFQKAYASGNAA